MNRTLEVRLAENAWHGDTTFYELIPLGDVLSIDKHDDVKFPEEVVLHIDENEYAYVLKTAEKCKIISGTCSRCGALIHESANMYWQYFDGGFRTVMHKPVNFCPNCGREVEK